MRAAPVVGPGAERLPARILLGRPPLRVRGASPPVQVVHVDALAAALALVVTSDLPGVYNVAADGWLPADEARAQLRATVVPAFPQEALERALHRTWELGLGDVPPGIVPYLAHPWVIANDKLRAAGWSPAHSNADAIAEAARALPPRPALRNGAIVVGAGGVAVVAGVAGARLGRRRRRARRAQPATGVTSA